MLTATAYQVRLILICNVMVNITEQNKAGRQILDDVDVW